MILEKYRPKKIEEMIDNRSQAMEILNMIKNYKKGRGILVYGPPGCGKTLSIELIAKKLNYEIVRLTAADFRSYNQLKRTILQSSLQSSLLYSGKILLIDELEFVFDPGMKRGIRELIKESPYPVVLISQNPYVQQLREIRAMCKLVKFNKVRWTSIAKYLEKIAKHEKIKYEKRAIDQLARMSNGDVRAALIDLASLNEVTMESIKSVGDRDQEQSIFDTLKIIFKTTDIENSSLALEQSDKTPDEIFWWIEENIFREYESPEEVAKAYGFLSFADFFKNQITKRQAWSLQKYFLDGLIMISVAKKKVYRKYVKYESPKFFLQFKRRVGKELETVLEKIGEMTHTSKKRAMSYIPLMKILIKKRHATFGFSKEELDQIISSNITSV